MIDACRAAAPADGDRPIAARIRELDALVGRARFVEVCVDLLGGADRTAYVAELRYLTGHEWADDDPVRDPTVWKDYWVRTWGARGLLHCWDDVATPAVVAGLRDEHYRPAEMCLKVAAAARRRRHGAGGGPADAARAAAGAGRRPYGRSAWSATPSTSRSSRPLWTTPTVRSARRRRAPTSGWPPGSTCEGRWFETVVARPARSGARSGSAGRPSGWPPPGRPRAPRRGRAAARRCRRRGW